MTLAPHDQRSNGSIEGHEPGVLPAGMTFDCVELAEAYLAGARSARTHHPASDHLIERACDAYVKLAHVRRLDG